MLQWVLSAAVVLLLGERQALWRKTSCPVWIAQHKHVLMDCSVLSAVSIEQRRTCIWSLHAVQKCEGCQCVPGHASCLVCLWAKCCVLSPLLGPLMEAASPVGNDVFPIWLDCYSVLMSFQGTLYPGDKLSCTGRLMCCCTSTSDVFSGEHFLLAAGNACRKIDQQHRQEACKRWRAQHAACCLVLTSQRCLVGCLGSLCSP
jgi:hypothetical protein